MLIDLQKGFYISQYSNREKFLDGHMTKQKQQKLPFTNFKVLTTQLLNKTGENQNRAQGKHYLKRLIEKFVEEI